MKTSCVPGNKTLMPYIVEILKENNGELSYSKVVYLVLFEFNVPRKSIKKAFTEVSFAGTYLRKVGALEKESKKGIWILTNEFKDMESIEFTQLRKILNKRYANVIGKR